MSRQDAAESASAGAEPLVYAARRIDAPTVEHVAAATDERHVAWFHPDEPDAVAVGAAATVTVDGQDRFGAAADRIDAVFDRLEPAADAPEAAAPRAFGGFSFFPAGGRDDGAVWGGFADATFAVPRVQLRTADDGGWLTVTLPRSESADLSDALDEWRARFERADGPEVAMPSATEFDATPDREEWMATVEDAIARIGDGDLEKVVLAQQLRADLDGPVPVGAVLSRLRETYPNCVAFACAPEPERTFFGATPETLVSLRGGRVETEALAGTTDRGDSEAEDSTLAEAMLGDEKYQVENGIVADTIAEQLRPVAREVTVADPAIKKVTNLQHLHRPISATVEPGTDILDVAERLHPTPAVGGYPTPAARDLIREVEAFDRGWYASPVGWVDADGDGTFVVAIRSALARDSSLSLYGGAGIVAESDPATEYGEVRSRFRPVLDAMDVEGPSD